MLQTKRLVKILDFDIENRPLSYWTPDRPTAEITAIASCWTDDLGSMQVHLLGRDDPRDMLQAFVARYNEADIVTGHYIRRHDLPIINGALIEYGLPQLSAKLTIDTRIDLPKKGDIPATQEYLSDLFDIPAEKYHMTQYKWRKANRLGPEGLKEAEKRAKGDVYQHMLLRLSLAKAGLLSKPKIWRP